MHSDELKSELAIQCHEFMVKMQKTFGDQGLRSMVCSWKQNADRNGIAMIETVEISMDSKGKIL